MRRGVKRLAVALLATALQIPAHAQECKGSVYLSFDTGNMSQAELIARVLKEERVKATFFVANEKTARGDHALDPSWREYWRARVAEGHVFGNHTWSHFSLRRDLDPNSVLALGMDGKELRLDKAGFCADLEKVDKTFQQLTGERLSGLWRAPGGRVTQQSLRWAASCGYPLHAHWDDAGFIGDELPSDTHPNALLLKRALERIKPGDVLMMHLGIWSRKQPAAPILGELIQGLKARGLCFAPLAMATR